VLRKIYFDNARRLLVRSLPLPTLTAPRAEGALQINGRLDEPSWALSRPVHLEYLLHDGSARPELGTTVRATWSDEFLYLGYECPFTELTVFEPADLKTERFGLWERDVVEAFIGSDAGNGWHYYEFEVSPNGERLDLELGGTTKDLEWNSGFEAAVRTDGEKKVWTTELRIPLRSMSGDRPARGTQWRLNLYRHDRAHNAFLAWSPTATATAHMPERFGYLEFGD
jgi:hypothetical protein